MTFSVNKDGFKFNRTWIDRIMGKVDKDQGVANAGKVLGIGDDGQVVPVEQSGGGSSVWVEPVSISSYADLVGKVKVGDELIITASTRSITVGSSNATFMTTTDGLIKLTAYSTSISDRNRTFHLVVTSIDGSNNIIKCTSNLLDSADFGQPFADGTYINTYTLNMWYVEALKDTGCSLSWTYVTSSMGDATHLGETLAIRNTITSSNAFTVNTIIHKS